MKAQPQMIALPEPRLRGKVSLEQALASRRSRRAYRGEPLALAEAAQLLWAAQGITGPDGQRTAPSAGARYPLEIYLAAVRVEGLEAGIYHYDPDEHALELQAAGDRRRELTAAASSQDCVRFAPCTLLLTAVVERSASKYGERAGKYIDIEAGHVAQNVYLEAEALGLGVCAVGAFSADAVRAVAELGPDREIVYLLTAGHRA